MGQQEQQRQSPTDDDSRAPRQAAAKDTPARRDPADPADHFDPSSVEPHETPEAGERDQCQDHRLDLGHLDLPVQLGEDDLRGHHPETAAEDIGGGEGSQ